MERLHHYLKRARSRNFLLLGLAALFVLAACQPLPPGGSGGGGAGEGTGSTSWTIFGSRKPAFPSAAESQPVELGVRFKASSDGSVTGVRFYKSDQNTGTHTGNLWTNSGTRLATATFKNETANGWQSVTFAQPVKVTAGQTYVASYHAPNGHYAADQNFFQAATTNGPLTALADKQDGLSGVYGYNATSAFPTQGWYSANYWVDVTFVAGGTAPAPAPAPAPTPTPAPAPAPAPTPAPAPAPGSGSVPASFPNASNTGIKPGVQLQTISGSVVLDANYAKSLPGAGTPSNPWIFENKRVNGMLQIAVPNVLVRNSRIIGNAYYSIWSPADHVTVEDSEIGPDGNTGVDVALSFENYGVAKRVNVHNGRMNIKTRSNTVIEDSYIHTVYQGPGDHTDGFNTPQGDNGVIRHNTILGNTVPNNGRTHNGISIYTDRGPSRNWLIEGNYIDHNGFHIYADVIAPFIVRNNVLTEDYERTPNTKTYFFNAQPGWTAYGNVNEKGQAITLK